MFKKRKKTSCDFFFVGKMLLNLSLLFVEPISFDSPLNDILRYAKQENNLKLKNGFNGPKNHNVI